MIPIGSTVPLQRTPWVTFVVMAACIGLFGFELYQQYTGRDLAAFFTHYGWVPAQFSEAVVQGRLPRLLPLLSSIFLHGGWTHLIGNLFFLYVFGRHVEDRLGAGCYVLFFCFGGVAAMLVQTYVAPFSTVPMIGASGAIAAVAGAHCVLYPTARILTCIPLPFFFRVVRVPAVGYLLVWLVLLFVSELYLAARSEQLMTWRAHLGGFVAGVIFGPLSVAFQRWRTRRKRMWRPDSPLIVENSRSGRS